MKNNKKRKSKPEVLNGGKTGLRQLNEENRKKALSSQDTVTAQRKAEGWAWMQKGKTTKQVAPANIEKNINDGFKII